MPPRLSARRLCLVIVFLGAVMVLVTINHRLPWQSSKSSVQEDVLPLPTTALPEIEVAEETEVATTAEKLWFFQRGSRLPSQHSNGLPTLFPDQSDGDRIIDQLMYVPEDYQGVQVIKD